MFAKNNGTSENPVTALYGLQQMSELHPHAQLALEAAHRAGVVMTSVGSNHPIYHGLSKKDVADFVTDIDTRAESAIIRTLRLETPDYAILSEESGETPRSSGKHCGLRWVVDPLDGTSAYIFKTNPLHPSVMLTLERDSQAEMSLVYVPLTLEWFMAVKGSGAFYSYQGLMCHQVKTPDSRPLAESWVAMNQYGDAKKETVQFANLRERLRSASGAALVTIEAPHSSLGCRVVAPPGPHVLVHDNSLKYPKQARWDWAPVKLFVEEAGGVFVNTKGEPYSEKSDGAIIVATHQSVADEVIGLM